MKSEVRISDAERLGAGLSPDTARTALQSFVTHGYVVLHNALDPAFVANLRDAWLARYGDYDRDSLARDAHEVGDGRYQVVVGLESPFDHPGIYGGPTVYPLIRALLGKRCILQSYGSVVALPGAKAQNPHVDAPRLWPQDELNVRTPTYAVNVVVPLVDVGAEGGTTAVWEGSHRLPIGAGPRVTEPVPVVAEAGAVYLIDYRTWHHGTANNSASPRPLLYMLYSRPWYRDAVNFYREPPMLATLSMLEKVPRGLRHLFLLAEIELARQGQRLDDPLDGLIRG